MKKKLLVLLFSLFFICINITNVFAHTEERKNWNGDYAEGWWVDVYSDNSIEVGMLYDTKSSSVCNSWTENYWEYYMERNGAVVENHTVHLLDRINGGSKCNCTYTTSTIYSDDTAGFYWIPNNGSPAGSYVIYGEMGPASNCRRIVSASGDYTLNLTEMLNLSYTISYNANGGTGSTASQTVSSGGGVNLQANGYSRTGYTFNGWNTNSNATGTHYNAGQWVSFGGNVTLYAEWIPNKYNLTLDPNGGDFYGSTVSKVMQVTYDSTNYSRLDAGVIPKKGQEWKLVGYDIRQTLLPTNATQNNNNKGVTTLVYDADGVATNKYINSHYYFNNYMWNYTGNVTVYAKWIDITKPGLEILRYNPTLKTTDGKTNYTNQNVDITIKVSDYASGLKYLDLIKNDVLVDRIKSYTGENEDTVIYTTEKNLLATEKYQLRVTDIVDNVTTYNLNVDTIDKIKPTYKLLSRNGEEIACGSEYDSDGTIIIQADDNYSGFKKLNIN